ncbi:MAG: hypothetical protein ACREUE_15145 [Panacagrimonas sp.]
MDDEARRQLLYQGHLFVYSKTPATADLIELGRSMLEAAFAPHDPQAVHRYRSAEEVAAILAVMKPRFIHHPECKVLVRRILEERGLDPARVYFDLPRMRSAYPADFLTSGIAYAFHPHRDTWYSAPPTQINWWIPVFDVESDNAMGFFPRYFSEGVVNSSAGYNYYTWNKEHRGNAAQHVRSDTRVQPRAQEDIQRVTMRVLPPPGGLILFSGAQLHETVPNTTGIARYSIDFRTVHLDDVVAGRGAPNVDSRSGGTTMRDYLRASDLEHIPEDVVARYDDGTERDAGILYFGDRLLRKDA